MNLIKRAFGRTGTPHRQASADAARAEKAAERADDEVEDFPRRREI